MFKFTPVQRLVADAVIVILAFVASIVFSESWPFIKTVAIWVIIAFIGFFLFDGYRILKKK